MTNILLAVITSAVVIAFSKRRGERDSLNYWTVVYVIIVCVYPLADFLSGDFRDLTHSAIAAGFLFVTLPFRSFSVLVLALLAHGGLDYLVERNLLEASTLVPLWYAPYCAYVDLFLGIYLLWWRVRVKSIF